MNTREIKLIITDFDGTLVNTFKANFYAYRDAFASVKLDLPDEKYKQMFGFRFEKFMEEMGITDNNIRKKIQETKSDVYPNYFQYVEMNKPLAAFIKAFKQKGGLTAIASTARRKNLENILKHLDPGIEFDLIMTGESVKEGKPHPEIYNSVMNALGVKPNNTLIFEDSPVGIAAAEASGAGYIVV
jgi:haloacid dehalogenase superfamily, subfamily IA, variant 3 with third motif having DD or ED